LAARHDFLNDHARDHVPELFVVMGKLTGAGGYDEASAEDARQRIVTFFNAHLKP
jgi:carboxymethylenebutenolidase